MLLERHPVAQVIHPARGDRERVLLDLQQTGDASKARTLLGWQPTVDFTGLVHRMVDHDIELLGEKA